MKYATTLLVNQIVKIPTTTGIYREVASLDGWTISMCKNLFDVILL